MGEIKKHTNKHNIGERNRERESERECVGGRREEGEGESAREN